MEEYVLLMSMDNFYEKLQWLTPQQDDGDKKVDMANKINQRIKREKERS